MWHMVGYLLALFYDNGVRVVDRSLLDELVFDVLWRRYRLALAETKQELDEILGYLADLRLVEIKDNNILLIDGLREFKQTVEESKTLKTTPLVREYIDRLREAVGDVVKHAI